MTRQQAFGRVWDWFVVQGHGKSIRPCADDGNNDDVQCAYRSPDGSRCAIGVLIDEDWYCEALEGKGVAGLIERKLLPYYLVNLGKSFLVDLQRTHDWSVGYNDFLDKTRLALRNLALTYGLTVPDND